MTVYVTPNGTVAQGGVAHHATQGLHCVASGMTRGAVTWQSCGMSTNFPNLPAAITSYLGRGSRTQADLARALHVSRATVTRWVQGEEPEVKRLQEIARELGVTVGYLAGDEEIAWNGREIRLLAAWRRQPEHIRAVIEHLQSEAREPGAPNPKD